MSERRPRKVDRRRLTSTIVDRLAAFPRDYAALENAMAKFGDDFELSEFKTAFESNEDLDAYNRAQSVEQAIGRVQNYVAEIAIAAANLAQLPSGDDHGSKAVRAFIALRDAKVIDGRLCEKLTRAQSARSAIEHSYVDISAGETHRWALLIHDTSLEFIGQIRPWIEELLESSAAS